MTIPLLLALVIVHFALLLPSAAFPDVLEDCPDGVDDCPDGYESSLGRLDTGVKSAGDRTGLGEDDAGSGGFAGAATETFQIVAGAVKQVWYAMGAVRTILTFDYKILDAGSYTEEPGVGTGIMGTMMLGLRVMLGVAQLVIGVRILLAVRGSGGL